MSSATDDPRIVRIAIQSSDLFADFVLDDAGVTVTSGFGGWSDQARGRRRALLVFDGPGSWGQDIAVAMDAYGEDREKQMPIVRRQWQVLRALWSLPHPGAAPPLATLTGKLVWGADSNDQSRNWALMGMQPTEQRYENVGGELVRWVGVLSFSQVIPSEVLRITGAPTAGGRIHVVKKGETLASIARAEHVPAAKITRADGKKIRDPKSIKPGDRLRLPPRKP